MPISKDQARDLSKAFLDLSHLLGEYRFANWGTLTTGQRRSIEDAEWDLLNYSGSILTVAVGIALEDMQKDLKRITDATAKAKKVVRKIQKVKNVIKVAAAVIVLGGAIASKNPKGIVEASGDLIKVVQDVSKKKQKKGQ